MQQPGSEAFEVVPDSRLVVTRQAFKNNSSRYTINGRLSSYTEVQTLLKGRGIDLDHKRFLILQVCQFSLISFSSPKVSETSGRSRIHRTDEAKSSDRA